MTLVTQCTKAYSKLPSYPTEAESFHCWQTVVVVSPPFHQIPGSEGGNILLLLCLAGFFTSPLQEK